MNTTILWVLFGLALVVGLYHLLHGIFIDRHIVYTQAAYTSPQVPLALEGYRIAFLTDFHNISTRRLMEVIEDVQRQSVDIVLLGGDFDEDSQQARHDLMLLSLLSPEDGLYGVLGNHDCNNHLFHHMRDFGMVPLSNEGVRLRSGLYLGGTEDYRLGTPDITAALGKGKAEEFKLLLTHNPDVSMLRGGELPDLVLGGHTHGGEVSVFGVYPPWVAITSDYGFRFSGGWTSSSFGTDVYVSRGLGRHFFLRVFVPPEVVYVTLHSGETTETKASPRPHHNHRRKKRFDKGQ